MQVQAFKQHVLRVVLGVVMASAAAVPAIAQAGDSRGASGGWPWDLQVGGMVFVAPKYEGSKDYQVMGFPFIAPAGGSGFVQFRGPDDLRFRVINTNGFEAGPLIGWRFGRDDTDSFRLRGLGDVDGGLVLGGYAGYRAGPLMPFVSYHHQVTGDDSGGVIRFGAELTSKLPAGISLTTTLGASYASSDYMDAYFSVTPAQSLASVAGLRPFDADAGIKDVYLGFSADVPLAERWTLRLNARYSRLLGDATDSPIVESENQFSGGLGVTYRFGAGR